MHVCVCVRMCVKTMKGCPTFLSPLVAGDTLACYLQLHAFLSYVIDRVDTGGDLLIWQPRRHRTADLSKVKLSAVRSHLIVVL